MLNKVPKRWGWGVGRLADISDIKIGGTPSRSNPVYWAQGNKGFTWVSIADLKQGLITGSKEKITQLGVDNSNVKRIPIGTVLMSFKLTIGRVAVAGTELFTNEAIAAFDLDNEMVMRDFIYQYLPTFVGMVEAEQAVKGKTLNKKALAEVPVILPPLKEQERIAEILGSVDASIQAAQAVIAQAECVKRGLIEELLTGGLGSEAIERGEVPEGWERSLLSELCMISGEYGANASKEQYNPSLPRYIRITDINEDGTLDDSVKVSLGTDQAKRYELMEGDVLIARSGSVGKSYVYSEQDGWCVFAGYLLRFRLDDRKASHRWLKHALQTQAYWNWVKDTQRIGAQPNINAKEYGTYILAVPPLSEQQRIADILSSVDDFIAKQKATVEQQAAIKKGLMDDLLMGRVRTV